MAVPLGALVTVVACRRSLALSFGVPRVVFHLDSDIEKTKVGGAGCKKDPDVGGG